MLLPKVLKIRDNASRLATKWPIFHLHHHQIIEKVLLCLFLLVLAQLLYATAHFY